MQQLCFTAKNKKLLDIKNIICISTYELDNFPVNSSNNFSIKNSLFGAVKLTRDKIKRKLTCNDYGIAFDRSGSWSSSNESPQNVGIFGVGNSSSRYS